MRIDDSLDSRFNALALNSPPARISAAGHHRLQATAHDSYTRNASNAPVLDAEYVDDARGQLPATASQRPVKENRIGPELYEIDATCRQQVSGPASSCPTGRYLALSNPGQPDPGTFLSVFA